MRYVVAHHIFYKERREPDAHHWEEQEEHVGGVGCEAFREQLLYEVDDPMEQEGCHGCQDADEERQHLCGLLVCEVALPPGYQFFQHGLAYDESNVVRPRGRWGLVDVIS